ncbi:serine threonine protein kinase-like protein [Stylonychia lemnae]|uniref:Serine threonine protein kinase-like protein n=1 Tax=Stylonychia lemnae TaxID=5949 RepID=A0A078AYN3_STYLE|nr:serine threonine protein kinase-like protein [Stylonychia lemnae]|eukprot:CDW87246.1 serine threonine protein kinase-like protein [Stylonychia lemnae]
MNYYQSQQDLDIQIYLSQFGLDQLLKEGLASLAKNKPQNPVIYLAEFLQSRANIIDGKKIEQPFRQKNKLGTNEKKQGAEKISNFQKNMKVQKSQINNYINEVKTVDRDMINQIEQEFQQISSRDHEVEAPHIEQLDITESKKIFQDESIQKQQIQQERVNQNPNEFLSAAQRFNIPSRSSVSSRFQYMDDFNEEDEVTQKTNFRREKFQTGNGSRSIIDLIEEDEMNQQIAQEDLNDDLAEQENERYIPGQFDDEFTELTQKSARVSTFNNRQMKSKNKMRRDVPLMDIINENDEEVQDEEYNSENDSYHRSVPQSASGDENREEKQKNRKQEIYDGFQAMRFRAPRGDDIDDDISNDYGAGSQIDEKDAVSGYKEGSIYEEKQNEEQKEKADYDEVQAELAKAKYLFLLEKNKLKPKLNINAKLEFDSANWSFGNDNSNQSNKPNIIRGGGTDLESKNQVNDPFSDIGVPFASALGSPFLDDISQNMLHNQQNAVLNNHSIQQNDILGEMEPFKDFIVPMSSEPEDLFDLLGCDINANVKINSPNQTRKQQKTIIRAESDDDFGETQKPVGAVLLERDPSGQEYKTSSTRMTTSSAPSEQDINSILNHNRANLIINQNINMNTTTRDNEKRGIRIAELAGITEVLSIKRRDQAYLIKDKGQIILAEFVQKYKDLYADNKELLLQRAVNQQNVKLMQNDNESSNVHILTDKTLMKFLQTHSKKYSNVIEVRELAKGGEAIVYRLEHQNLDEVIAKCTLINDNQEDSEIYEAFMEILAESQQLKILANNNYIAQVQEEIIIMNQQEQVITQYVAIVERAQHTLQDLLQIWNNKDQSESLAEFYSPEKLTYYFYQTMCIVQFLNQRKFYYGDMKPQNLLVFRDQRLKVGDLGISIKAEPGKSDDAKLYRLKGVTTAYAKQNILQAFRAGTKLSFKELLDADKFSVLRTFEKCIQSVSKLHDEIFPGAKKYYQNMFQDLVDKSLQETIQKWTTYFAVDTQFSIDLGYIMKQEGKSIALPNIYRLTKFKDALENYLFKIYKRFRVDYNDRTDEFNKDNIGCAMALEFNPEIDAFAVELPQNTYMKAPRLVEQNLSAETKALKDSQEWKHICLEIMESWYDSVDQSGNNIFSDDRFAHMLKKYFFMTDQEQGFTCQGQIEVLSIGQAQKNFESQFTDFQFYMRWCMLTVLQGTKWENNQEQIQKIWQDNQYLKDSRELNSKLKNYFKVCATAAQIWKYRNNECDLQSHLKFLLETLEAGFLALPMLIDQVMQEAINLAQQIRLPIKNEILDELDELLGTRDSYDFSLSSQQQAYKSFVKSKQLEQNKQLEESMKVHQEIISKYINIFGQGHSLILQVYGDMGKLMLQIQDKNTAQAWQFLNKYSKLSSDALIEYIDLKQKNNGSQEDLQEAISRWQFENSVLSRQDWNHILQYIYLRDDSDNTQRKQLIFRLSDLFSHTTTTSSEFELKKVFSDNKMLALFFKYLNPQQPAFYEENIKVISKDQIFKELKKQINAHLIVELRKGQQKIDKVTRPQMETEQQQSIFEQIQQMDDADIQDMMFDDMIQTEKYTPVWKAKGLL